MILLGRCFKELQGWKDKRQSQRKLVQEHQDYRNDQLVENAFEGLVLYVRYARVKRECIHRADSFLTFSLAKKAFSALLLHKIHRSNDKDMIGQVQMARRRAMFTNWFNHVHDFLPKKRQAEEFRLQKLFESMRQVVVDRRGDRAHKALLAELVAEFRPYILKRRGVQTWYRFTQRTMLGRTKRILCNKIALSRMFQAWFANVDRLREGKRRHLMWKELYTQQQYRRGLTALRLHCEKKQHEKQIIAVFNERRDMYIKARVYAAMFDNSCETKLKLAGFMHYMVPKATHLIASYFQKWRDT